MKLHESLVSIYLLKEKYFGASGNWNLGFFSLVEFELGMEPLIRQFLNYVLGICPNVSVVDTWYFLHKEIAF